MTVISKNSALEQRIKAIKSRIAVLTKDMLTADDCMKVRDSGELVQLRQRQKYLEERVHELKHGSTASPHGFKAEVALMVDDLAEAMDELMSWMEEGCSQDPKQDSPRHSPK